MISFSFFPLSSFLFGYRHATFEFLGKAHKTRRKIWKTQKQGCEQRRAEQSSEAEEDWKTRSLMQRRQRDEVARQPVMVQQRERRNRNRGVLLPS